MRTAGNKFLFALLLAVIFITVGSFSFWRILQNKPPENSNFEELTSGQTFLQSPFMNEESYGEVFFQLPQKNDKIKIKAGIVSHHFLAKKMIAEFYNKIGNDDIGTIFLVSPDHFNNFFESGKIAYTSYLPWRTPFGNLAAESGKIAYLIENHGVAANDPAVGLEHGISVETPFIKYFFPRAAVVPIIMRNGSSYGVFFKLGQEIKKISGDDAIMVVSSDFSHALPSAAARIKDEGSIAILKDLKHGNLDGINNDCRPCLAALAGFLGEEGKFFLVDNKNSFDFSNESEESVTSYISGYYTEK